MSARPATPRAPGVLFIVSSLETGGAERQVVTLLNHLDAGRFRLHLAYLKRNETLLPQLRQERLATLLCCDVARRVDGEAIRRLRRLLVAGGIDTIVCTNPYPTLYARLALRGSGARPKVVTVFHTTQARGLKERTQMLLYRQLFNRVDLLIYVCETQRAHWRARGMHPAADEVIYNGIDTDYYSSDCSGFDGSGEARRAVRRSFGLDDGDFVTGLCSVFRPEKAHGDLLAAIARLRARGLPAKALLIGDGPERAAIERQIARLGLQGHVFITGLREDVRPFIGACDVMALVSHSVEAFSLAALESMALGKPMVMSEVGGASELVVHGEHGFLFPSADIEGLTLRLQALTDRALRERLGRAAALRVRERFTVQAMCDRFAACLEGLDAAPAPQLPPADGEHVRASRLA